MAADLETCSSRTSHDYRWVRTKILRKMTHPICCHQPSKLGPLAAYCGRASISKLNDYIIAVASRSPSRTSASPLLTALDSTSFPVSCQNYLPLQGYVSSLSFVIPFFQLAWISFQSQIGILTIPGIAERSKSAWESISAAKSAIWYVSRVSSSLYLWLPLCFKKPDRALQA